MKESNDCRQRTLRFRLPAYRAFGVRSLLLTVRFESLFLESSSRELQVANCGEHELD